MARKGSRGSRRSSVRAMSSLASLLELSPIGDLRTWHPDPDRPVTDLDGRLSRVVIGLSRMPAALRVGIRSRSRTLPASRFNTVGQPLTSLSSKLPVGVRFEAPRRVALCVRRKSRREVIFAKRKAGAGARSRRRRHDWRSEIHC